MWSEKTLERRDRYQVLFGATQALWAAGAATALSQAVGAPALGWALVSVAAMVSSAIWRRSWRRYRAATLAEIAATRAQGVLYAAMLKAVREGRE
jgi:hypothetical protein